MVVIVRMLVWDEVYTSIVVVVKVVVIGVLVDVKVAVGFIVIVWKFPLSALYAVDVPSDGDLFMDALTGVMFRVLTGIDIELFADVNLNVFAVLADLNFPVSASLKEFCR